MRRATWIGLLGWAAVAALGCSSAKHEPPADPTAGQAATSSSATPDRVVFEFLEAFRNGDDERATNLLTETARARTAEMDLVVAPPASSSAQFEVGEVEYVTPEKDGAHVASTWAEPDEDGTQHVHEVIWVLRKEAPGWRILGMATKVFDDAPPLILNFEDPEDMLRKQQLVAEEIRRRAEEHQFQAQQPPDATAPQLK
jgi:hypothetical protein